MLEERRVLASLSFSDLRIIDQAEGPNEPIVVNTYDLDNDGDQDVLAGFQDGSVGWFANDGTGRLSELNLIGQGTFAASWISVGDMDADGDNDVLVTQDNGLHAMIYQNQGDQIFSSFSSRNSSRTTTKSLLSDY